MTIKELMEQLQERLDHGMSPDAEVLAYDGVTETWEPVTGMIYDTRSIELQTDDPS